MLYYEIEKPYTEQLQLLLITAVDNNKTNLGLLTTKHIRIQSKNERVPMLRRPTNMP